MPKYFTQGIRALTRKNSSEREIASAIFVWCAGPGSAARRVELAKCILRRLRKLEGDRVYAVWDGETLLVASDRAAIVEWAKKRGGIRLLDVTAWRAS